MNNLEIFTSSFVVTAALILIFILAIAAAIMPLYVISISGQLKKMQDQLANAQAQNARLLTNIHAVLSRLEIAEVTPQD
jgi:hypothetical protein